MPDHSPLLWPRDSGFPAPYAQCRSRINEADVRGDRPFADTATNATTNIKSRSIHSDIVGIAWAPGTVSVNAVEVLGK
jgi:hypothetical protein